MSAFYALEAAVTAAAIQLQHPMKKSHSSKVEVAEQLSLKHGLPEIGSLLRDLNEARKSEAYGDVATPPSLDAEDVAGEVEAYIDAVATHVGS